MASETPTSTGARFERLVAIMAQLRAPGGCPWDREQTFDTIKPYLLEESYEVMESIDARDWEGLADELGDLMLQAVFFAQMASEQGLFTIDKSLDAISDKLVRRHPHIFAGTHADTPAEVKRRWDEIKAEERRRKGEKERALLDKVSRSVPALVEAQELTQRAASVGFDWENPEQVIGKLHEELGELAAARQATAPAPAALEDELGDMLFVLVNLARFLHIDAEQALRKTNAKFRRRFGYLEAELNRQGVPLAEAGIERMENLWQEAKRHE